MVNYILSFWLKSEFLCNELWNLVMRVLTWMWNKPVEKSYHLPKLHVRKILLPPLRLFGIQTRQVLRFYFDRRDEMNYEYCKLCPQPVHELCLEAMYARIHLFLFPCCYLLDVRGYDMYYRYDSCRTIPEDPNFPEFCRRALALSIQTLIEIMNGVL